MKPNNFKSLENEQVNKFESKKEHVKSKVDGSIGLIKFIGNIFELYLPQVLGVFGYMSGNPRRNKSSPENTEKKYPNTK